MQGEYDSSGAEEDEDEGRPADDKRAREAARERFVVALEKFFLIFKLLSLSSFKLSLFIL